MPAASVNHSAKNLALIPARGGSKGVPGKNLAQLGGRPLLAWAVEVALEAGLFADVVVSTDSPEIAQAAREHGARAPFLRPADLAGDAAPTYPAIAHALDWLRAHEGKSYEHMMLLQPTAPFRSADDLKEAFMLLAGNPQADGVVSLCRLEEPHPWKVKRISDGWVAPFLEELEADSAVPRQQAPPAYFLNGAIYLARVEPMLARGSLLSDHFLPYLMPPERSLNIDTPLDLLLARTLLEQGGELG
jgi:CMP-N,N'-diacetyllegionaminic acid synthase